MANYYDIDDIITEEQNVVAVFQKAVNGVGIDLSSEKDAVEPGSKLELPLWLAQELHLRQVATMNVPICFDQKTKLEIQADPACVDLKSRSPYFYEFGCKIAPLVLHPTGVVHGIVARSLTKCMDSTNMFVSFRQKVGDKTIGFLLFYAFKSRFKEVLSKAHTSEFPIPPKFLACLTKEEANLYDAARASMSAFKKWRLGGPRFQRASILGRKRKPTD